MKKYIFSISLLCTMFFSLAQVAIGKETVDGDGILDFENPTTKGILLPRVLVPNAGSVPGTILYNAIDKKVKYKNNSTWVDLSIETGSFDVSEKEYLNSVENPDTPQGMIIGAETTTAVGVLVLESNEKALILPKMANPHTTIKAPKAGMMAYDTLSKTLFVFNGTVWTIWGK